MQISYIAAKQKRILDWAEFVQHGGVPDPALRRETEAKISEFKKIIAGCWIAGVVSPADEAKILDLERSLEQLNEEARILVGGNISLKKDAAAA